MPSTYSSLKIELPATGEQSGTWGNTTNTNLGTALEEAIVGSANVTFASANVTLTLTDTNAAQTARNLRLNLIGVTGGVARTLTVPAIEKLYLISNNCADAITVKNATGSGVTVPAGNNVWVYNDGTDVLSAITYITSLSTGAFSATSLTDSGLTSGRVTYAGTAGLLQDSANLTFNGTTLTAAGLSDSGNLTFTGTGNRITGDFSNVTTANRVAFQSSTTNGNTSIPFIPNGTATTSALFLYNGSDTANAAFLNINNSATATTFNSTITGTGTYLPMTFVTGGSERLRITTAGIVDIGGSSGGSVGELLVVEGANSAGHRAARINNTSTTNGYSTLWMGSANDGLLRGGSTAGSFTDQLALLTSGAIPITFYTNNTERMRIDSSGNVGIGATSIAANTKLYVFGGRSNFVANSDAYAIGVGYASSGAYYLGANSSNNALIFSNSSGSEKIRFDDSGNVGIGTSTINTKVDVLGSQVLNRGVVEILDSTAVAAGVGAGITLGGYFSGSLTPGVQIKAAKTNATSGDYGFDMTFLNYKNGDANMTERMRIDSSGNVGIGTSSPTQKLDVQAAACIAKFTSTTGTNSVYTQMVNTGGSFYLGTDDSTGATSGAAYGRFVYGTGAYPMLFFTNSAERMRIDSSGNVGIGISTPLTKLDVYGPSSVTSFTGTTKLGVMVRGSVAYTDYSGIDFTGVGQTTPLGRIALLSSSVGSLMQFGTSNTYVSGITNTAMTIDQNGYVGIGNTSPASKLDVTGPSGVTSFTSGTALGITVRGATGATDYSGIDFRSAGANSGTIIVGRIGLIATGSGASLSFGTSNNYGSAGVTNTAMTIDPTGNVGIGMTPVASYGALQVGSAVTSALGVSGLKTYVSSTNSALGQNGNISVITTDAQGSDIGGSIGLGGKFVAAGTSVLFAQISGRKENSTDNNSAGYLQFATQPNGGTPTERMRINSVGDVLIGNSNTNPINARVNSTAFCLPSVGVNMIGRAGSVQIALGCDSNSGTNMSFYTDNGTAAVAAGSISSTGSTTAFNTGSDYRLKENIVPMTGALAKVSQLKPVTFDWKDEFSGGVKNGEGFIAHELQAVIPQAVTGKKDAVDKEGKPIYQGIDTSFLIATLTAAMQEQQALITNLTTRLNALEGK
jgi:hypothetical protein